MKVKPRIKDQKLQKAAYLLKSIANPTRMGIIDLLDQQERMSVTEIYEAIGAEQSLISHHLNNMRAKGLLKAEREGKQIYYSLVDRSVTNIIDCISNCKAIKE